MLFYNLLFQVFVFLFLFIKQKKTIYYLPTIVILYTALSVFFEDGLLGFRSFQLPFMVFLILFFYNGLKFFKVNVWIIFFILYLFVVVLPFADQKYQLLRAIVGLSTSLTLFYVGYSFIDSIDKLKKINGSLLIAGMIFIANFVLANVFTLGARPYDAGFYMGALHTDNSYIATLPIVLAPLAITLCSTKKQKVLYFIVSVLCALVLLLALRRGPVFLFLIGLVVIYLSLTLTNFRVFAKHIWVLIVLALVFYGYREAIEQRYLARGVAIYETIDTFEEVTRTQELIIVTSETLSFSDVSRSLWGHSTIRMDHTYGEYAGGQFGQRPIHTSLVMFLHGIGLIGFLFFFMIILKNFFLFFGVTRKTDTHNKQRTMLALSLLALLCMSAFDLYTKNYFFLTYLPITFLYQGSLLRLLKIKSC